MLLNSVSMSLRKDTKNAKKKEILKTWAIFPINLFSIRGQKTETLKAIFTRKKINRNVLMTLEILNTSFFQIFSQQNTH